MSRIWEGGCAMGRMKNQRQWHWLLLGLVVGTMVTNGWSQTAREWFERGVNSQNVNEKIVAYKRAIALDSSLVEAYYNLALAYKGKGDPSSVEQILTTGFIRYANQMDKNLKIKVLYELGIAAKKQENYASSEEALEAAVNLTIEEGLRSAMLLELGRVCLLDGKYDKALLHFNRGKELAAAGEKAQFDKGIEMVKSARQTEDLYQQAVTASNRGDFETAIRDFERVLALNPQYKDAANRLDLARQNGKRSSDEQQIGMVYQEALTLLTAKNYTEAIQKLKQVLAKNPNYRDARAKLSEAELSLDGKIREETMEKDYAEAIQALRRGNFPEAMLLFDRVRRVDPNYRDVNARYAEATANLNKQDMKSTIAKFYQQGVTAYEGGNYADAVGAFNRVLALTDNYRDTAELLANAQTKLKTTRGGNEEAATYYNQGLEEMAKGEFLQAVIAFEKVQMLNPNYKNVVERLADAKSLLKKAEQPAEDRKGGNLLATIGLALGLLLLPLVGIFAFSPEMRARILLLQGKYENAIKIYESMLTRNPGKVRLYMTLANIYMLEKRQDDRAVKTFEMVLRLNMDTEHYDKIIKILANYYLREGRTDPEALDIMEKAAGKEINGSNKNHLLNA